VTYLHPGGHALPAGAAQMVVTFFKDYARP
jgi:hypothetical protein